MRSLVTGASGFVGANLVRRLLREGDECHVVLRDASPRWRLDGVSGDLVAQLADVADAESISRAVVAARPDRVFHLAVHGAYSWEQGLERMTATNILGTANVLAAAAAAGCRVVVNTGSSAEYGDRDHAPAETEALEPDSHYAITKAAATWLVRQAARHSDSLWAPTLRLYSVYGPFEEPRRLVPTLLGACLAGRLPALAAPDTVRDFVHVDDAVDAYLLAARPQAGLDRAPVYNVGSGRQTRLDELVALCRELFAVGAEPAWGEYPARAWDVATWQADPSRIRRELGWEPRYSLRDGLAATAAWMTAPR